MNRYDSLNMPVIKNGIVTENNFLYLYTALGCDFLTKNNTAMKKRNTKRLLLLLTLFFNVAFVFAQQKTISGTVKDAQGNLLANASYLVKGEKKGGVTDNNGHFSVTVKDATAVLVFSSVNFKTQEVKVGQNATLMVVLDEALQV